MKKNNKQQTLRFCVSALGRAADSEILCVRLTQSSTDGKGLR